MGSRKALQKLDQNAVISTVVSRRRRHHRRNSWNRPSNKTTNVGANMDDSPDTTLDRFQKYLDVPSKTPSKTPKISNRVLGSVVPPLTSTTEKDKDKTKTKETRLTISSSFVTERRRKPRYHSKEKPYHHNPESKRKDPDPFQSKRSTRYSGTRTTTSFDIGKALERTGPPRYPRPKTTTTATTTTIPRPPSKTIQGVIAKPTTPNHEHHSNDYGHSARKNNKPDSQENNDTNAPATTTNSECKTSKAQKDNTQHQSSTIPQTTSPELEDMECDYDTDSHDLDSSGDDDEDIPMHTLPDNTFESSQKPQDQNDSRDKSQRSSNKNSGGGGGGGGGKRTFPSDYTFNVARQQSDNFHRTSLTPEQLMKQARNVPVDNENVFRLVMNTKSTPRNIPQTMQHGLIGSTIGGRRLTSSDSLDGSDLTMPTLNDDQKRSIMRWSNFPSIPRRETPIHHQRAYHKTLPHNLVESRAAAAALLANNRDVLSTPETPARVEEWSIEDENASVPIEFAVGSKRYIHPALPPGWEIQVSKSKQRPYYVHPDFGITWYCPVVLNQKPRPYDQRHNCNDFMHNRRLHQSHQNVYQYSSHSAYGFHAVQQDSYRSPYALDEENFDVNIPLSMSELINRYESTRFELPLSSIDSEKTVQSNQDNLEGQQHAQRESILRTEPPKTNIHTERSLLSTQKKRTKQVESQKLSGKKKLMQGPLLSTIAEHSETENSPRYCSEQSSSKGHPEQTIAQETVAVRKTSDQENRLMGDTFEKDSDDESSFSRTCTTSTRNVDTPILPTDDKEESTPGRYPSSVAISEHRAEEMREDKVDDLEGKDPMSDETEECSETSHIHLRRSHGSMKNEMKNNEHSKTVDHGVPEDINLYSDKLIQQAGPHTQETHTLYTPCATHISINPPSCHDEIDDDFRPVLEPKLQTKMRKGSGSPIENASKENLNGSNQRESETIKYSRFFTPTGVDTERTSHTLKPTSVVQQEQNQEVESKERSTLKQNKTKPKGIKNADSSLAAAYEVVGSIAHSRRKAKKRRSTPSLVSFPKTPKKTKKDSRPIWNTSRNKGPLKHSEDDSTKCLDQTDTAQSNNAPSVTLNAHSRSEQSENSCSRRSVGEDQGTSSVVEDDETSVGANSNPISAVTFDNLDNPSYLDDLSEHDGVNFENTEAVSPYFKVADNDKDSSVSQYYQITTNRTQLEAASARTIRQGSFCEGISKRDSDTFDRVEAGSPHFNIANDDNGSYSLQDDEVSTNSTKLASSSASHATPRSTTSRFGNMSQTSEESFESRVNRNMSKKHPFNSPESPSKHNRIKQKQRSKRSRDGLVPTEFSLPTEDEHNSRRKSFNSMATPSVSPISEVHSPWPKYAGRKSHSDLRESCINLLENVYAPTIRKRQRNTLSLGSKAKPRKRMNWRVLEPTLPICSLQRLEEITVNSSTKRRQRLKTNRQGSKRRSRKKMGASGRKKGAIVRRNRRK